MLVLFHLNRANSSSQQIIGHFVYKKRSLLNRSRIQTHSSHLHRQPALLRYLLSHLPIQGAPSHSIVASNPSDLHSDSHVAPSPIVIPNALIEVSPVPCCCLHTRHPELLHISLDSAPVSAPQQVTEFHPIPGVVSEPIDCSPFLVKEPPVSPTSSATAEAPVISVQFDSESQEKEPDTAPPPQPGCLQPPRITYERVDPLTLTRSPSGYPTPELDSLTGTPLPPHSPSWLSRNVQDYHPSVEPPSPPPLIIPPPVPVGYVRPPDSALISEEEFESTRILHTPSRPSSLHHSTSHSPRSSSDRCSSLWKSRSPTVVAQSPPSFLQRSNSFTPDNSPAPRQGLLFIDTTLPRVSADPPWWRSAWP